MPNGMPVALKCQHSCCCLGLYFYFANRVVIWSCSQAASRSR
jgi:hypothetical protein